jgi:flavin-dependent dehydrogenase
MSSSVKALGSDYDVVVIGGALSGAATATLLLRSNPGLRILILEKSAFAPGRSMGMDRIDGRLAQLAAAAERKAADRRGR